jgi:hypothetical protein
MGQGYQTADREIVDYELVQYPGVAGYWRGPPPESLEKSSYFVCVGAAQTFGRFCRVPFPTQVSRRIRAPVLNLGQGGVGPAFFLERPKLHPLINGARFAVVQVMSGRSESNRLFDAGGKELLRRRSDGRQDTAMNLWNELIKTHDRPFVDEIVEETLENWAKNMIRLLGSIPIPKVLLWISTRTPAYELSYEHAAALFGAFPQLVTPGILARVRDHAEHYVECVSTRGMPQPLFSLETGGPVTVERRTLEGGGRRTHNTYYPSPEMHEDVARALEPICRSLWA